MVEVLRWNEGKLLGEIAPSSIILKGVGSHHVRSHMSNDDAHGVVCVVAVLGAVGAVESAGYGESGCVGVCDYEIHNINVFI